MKRPKPDNRPSWRDDLKITYRGEEYSADEWQKMCQRAIDTDLTPIYKNDPTYDLKKMKDI
jgi:hypothetical protein